MKADQKFVFVFIEIENKELLQGLSTIMKVSMKETLHLFKFVQCSYMWPKGHATGFQIVISLGLILTISVFSDETPVVKEFVPAISSGS